VHGLVGLAARAERVAETLQRLRDLQAIAGKCSAADRERGAQLCDRVVVLLVGGIRDAESVVRERGIGMLRAEHACRFGDGVDERGDRLLRVAAHALEVAEPHAIGAGKR